MSIRSLPWSLGASLLGVAVGYGVSVAMGAPDVDSFRDSTERGREQLAALLQRKEEALDRREQTLVAREADLRAAEEKMAERLAELNRLREEINALLTDLDTEREARVVGLIKKFEAMRPPQAAAILEQTEESITLEILERMNNSKAGKILAAMKPEKAARYASRLGKAALDLEIPQ
jgi:flagellar motility protein MotE (MotC chaperone)